MENNKNSALFAFNWIQNQCNSTYSLEDLNAGTRIIEDGKYIAYGYDNLLPEKLLWLAETSPTHAAILSKKAKYTAGADIINTPFESEYEQEAFDNWCKNVNNGRGLQSLLQRISYDYHLFGGFTIQVIFYRNQRKIKDIIYQDFSQVRRGFTKDNNSNYWSQDIAISIDWDRRYEYKPQRFKYFHKNQTQTGSIPQDPVYMYFYKDSPGREWYPLPEYWAAHEPIYTEIAANSFLYNQMRNSFNPSGFLNLPAEMTKEQKNRFRKEIKENLQGSENAGKIVTLFSKPGSDPITWTPITDVAKYDGILDLQERNQRMIITGHSLTSPVLVGLPGGASLGGDGNTIEEAAKEFYNQTIKPAQKEILSQINTLVEGAGFNTEISVEDSYTYINKKSETDE